MSDLQSAGSMVAASADLWADSKVGELVAVLAVWKAARLGPQRAASMAVRTALQRAGARADWSVHARADQTVGWKAANWAVQWEVQKE